ncbi:MAG: hypothetical protein JWM16_700 [Verrucomicrobiales bacterium]|jgi:hypothetical protein|nr:hypothetical protein [Verrucomicrobiales bacterium]
MKPEDAQEDFEQRIEESGSDIADLTLAQGIRMMLDFYRDARAEGCPLDDDGDMLLFQWGAYDSGEGKHFQVDITRQFLLNENDEDGEISQLSFTFLYLPSDFHDSLGEGNEWCSSPTEVASFESFILKNAAYQAVKDKPTEGVELDYGEV